MRSRILLADDSITIQKVVNLTFADEGIDVVSVSNGEMAEKRLNEVNPDLVLADIFMPGKNGYELCETIKKNPQFRNVPVLLLVGAFEPFDQGEAKRVKADGHLTKPFESRTLVETVRKLIQSASSRPRTGPLPSVVPPMPQEKPERVDPLDTNPITPPPFSAESAGPDLPIEVSVPSLSETSPLDLDYSAAPVAHEPEPVPAPPQNESSGQYEGPFVRTTGALTSVGPGAVHHASGNGKPETSESLVDESLNGSGASPLEAHRSAGVPSTFGDQAEDLILDFDSSPEPAPPVETAPVLGEEEAPLDVQFESAAPSALVETPVLETPVLETPVFEADQVQQPVLESAPAPQPPVEEPVHAEPLYQEPVQAAPPVHEPVFESAGETEFVAIDAPVDDFVPAPAVHQSDVLQVDEPLGDVLFESESPVAEEAGAAAPEQVAVAEPFVEPDPVELLASETEVPTAELPSQADAVQDAVEEPKVELASDHGTVEAVVEPVVEAPALDVLMPPPIAPSVFDTTNLDWDDHHGGSSDPAYTTEHSEVVEAEAVAPEMTSEAEPLVGSEESFTSSAMWSDVEAKASPIDIEATSVDEAVEVASPVQDTVEPEAHTTAPVFEPEPLASVEAPAESEPLEVLSEAVPAISEEPAEEFAAESFATPEPEPQSVFTEPVMTDMPPAHQDVGSSAASQSAMIDEIVRRVVAELSESVVREIAWEVVPDCVERVVNQMTREGVAKRI